MLKQFLFLMAGVSLAGSLFAQAPDPDLVRNYRTAAGVRFGDELSVTVKYFTGKRTSFEALFGFRDDVFNSITFLYQRYSPVFAVRNLNWYYGGGPHIRSLDESTNERLDRETALGVNVLLGIEYKIPQAPIAISADIKPFVQTNLEGKFRSKLDPGIGIKLAF